MSPTCTNSHYDNHATFVPSINHNKDVALLSYVELYIYPIHILSHSYQNARSAKKSRNFSFDHKSLHDKSSNRSSIQVLLAL